MRYDAEHKARTRERVLRVAAEAIRADGPSGVGVAEIMGRAGLTHGGFYAHFKSKDDLIAAAIDAAFGEVDLTAAAQSAAGKAGAGTPQGVLATYIRFYLSRDHRDGRATGCPLPALSADMPRLGPEARARFGEGVAALTARLSQMIAACGIADAEAVAGSVLSEMQGALALARSVADEAQSEAILRRSRRAILGRLGIDAPLDAALPS